MLGVDTTGRASGSAVRLAWAVLLVALVSCKGETTEPQVATTLEASSSTSLAGVAGAAATPAPSVIVRDQNGSPMGGVPVSFVVASGGGSVTEATVTTGGSGIATAAWTLGPLTGSNVLNATSGTLPGISFTATSIAGPAALLAKNGGDNQTAAVGSAVPVAPSVIVRDANGNAKPDVTVTFSVVSGGGAITGATAVTNAAGVASVGSWTLGPAAGANVLGAASGTATGVSFTATATAGAATSIAKNGGDNQTGAAGSAVATPPSVIARDANGNATPGVSVTFAVVSGGGSITGATAVTNAAGVATVGSWTLGPSTGVNSLSATSGTLPGVSFTATAVAGPAASIVKNGGDNQSVLPGVTVPVPPSVRVTDANGNPKADITVTFAVLSGGGSITGASAVTNAAGVAAVGSWTLGGSAGLNTLSASVAGLASVTFNATALSPACTERATHTFGTTSSGTLASGDCQLPDGTFIDFYNTSIAQAGAYFFRQSAAFDTYLVLASPDGTTIGENDDEGDSGTNSGIKALLPAGNYLLGPGTFSGGVTGNYDISSSVAPTDVANCELVFVVKNVQTTQNISTTDCNLADPGQSPIYADRYFIFLAAGASVTIHMTSGSLDSFLQLVRLDGVTVAQNDNVDSTTKDSRITFTSTQASYYAIFPQFVPGSTVGAYTLTVQ